MHAAPRFSASLLSPAQVTAIGNLSIRAKLIVEGLIAGLHKSPYHGFSAEFLEYRPYQAGEAARRIDWRKFAKTDRPTVRLFEDETNLYAHLLVDMSGSMALGSDPPHTKFEYVKTLSAALAWILIGQRDAVGLALFDDHVRDLIPPRSTHVQLTSILSRLDRARPGGPTGCGGAIDAVAGSLRKRGLCILVSDFLDDQESIVRGMRHLRFQHQDVMALCIADPSEYRFAHRGPVRIRDMEDGSEVLLDGRIAAEALQEGIGAHYRNLRHACRNLGIDFEPITIDEPFHRALIRVLQKRGRMY